MDLNQFQSLLYKFITSPQAHTAGPGQNSGLPSDAIEIRVLGDERLSAHDRIEIYANAYFCRLLDCLREEFPATLAVVGPDNFAALVRDYLLHYPPSEPSINHAGRYLAEYLRNHRLVRQWPFIAELAWLERAISTSSMPRMHQH